MVGLDFDSVGGLAAELSDLVGLAVSELSGLAGTMVGFGFVDSSVAEFSDLVGVVFDV